MVELWADAMAVLVAFVFLGIVVAVSLRWAGVIHMAAILKPHPAKSVNISRLSLPSPPLPR